MSALVPRAGADRGGPVALDRRARLQDQAPRLPTHASVREILLIWSEERRIGRWLRAGDGWRHGVYTGESDVPVACIDEAIALADVYANLPYGEAAAGPDRA